MFAFVVTVTVIVVVVATVVVFVVIMFITTLCDCGFIVLYWRWQKGWLLLLLLV